MNQMLHRFRISSFSEGSGPLRPFGRESSTDRPQMGYFSDNSISSRIEGLQFEQGEISRRDCCTHT